MTELDDHDLIAEFARSESEEAFATLVTRHVNLVYSTAQRFTGNPHHAQEITQAVFIILARKSKSISRKTILSGWLYQTARLTAANFVRGEIRRQQREQEAYMQSTLNEPGPAAWEQIAPLLDEAMGGLGKTDRNAVVLRFFENRTAQEVGEAMKLTEAAAHKRTARALEKLRTFFSKRGVTLTSVVIAGSVSSSSVQAAPAGLAMTISAAAAKGVGVSATIATLVKGTMKTMTWLKIKFAAGVSAAALLVGGVATLSLPGKSVDGEVKAIPTGSHAGITAFSLLETMPIVANAVFEKELFLNGIPSGARKQTFSFRRDGDNYFFGVESGGEIQVGRFGGVVWQTVGGTLTEYDPKINSHEGGNGGMVGTESRTRLTVDLFLTLGIKEMKPGSGIWDESRQHLTGITDDGREVNVDIHLQDGVPSVATVLRDDGQAIASIKYKYAPAFYQGKVPVEFTRYGGNVPEDDKKVFTVRVQSLEISDGHLDTALIDPAKALKGYSTRCFYSNNIAYWIKPSGKVSRVLTMEEYKQEMERLKSRVIPR